MKKYIYLLLILCAGLSSCAKWLDVVSDSEIRDEAHYSTEGGFQQTLIGCYIGMTDVNLYGRKLSWQMLEQMARQYHPRVDGVVNLSDEYNFENYDYRASSTKAEIDNIWAKGYNVIVNANSALRFIDKKKEILNPISYNIIKGELLAVRAYMHFDLLRLFGYGNRAARLAELDAKYTLPYVTTISKDLTPQSTGAEYIDKLLADLTEAAELLKTEDPATGEHNADYYSDINENGFYNLRWQRLNYFAVRALMARVYLWEASGESLRLAREAAEEVITDAFKSQFVKWMTPDNVSQISAMGYEQLFAVNVADLETNYTGYINPNFMDSDSKALFVDQQIAETNIYEDIKSDIRFSKLMQPNTTSSTLTYVPTKIYQASSSNYLYKNSVPLIRIPEMYYIAAECYLTGPSPDTAKAMTLLNTVRTQRGIYTDLSGLDADQIRTEIAKEYRKEFYCEGVMFHYYKRIGAVNIPESPIEMDDKKYLLPFPDFEVQSGRIQ